MIANASATANHVDMEIVLNGVTASSLGTVSGVNFIPDPPSGGPSPDAALLVQSIAAGFPQEAALDGGSSSPSADLAGHQQTLALPTPG